MTYEEISQIIDKIKWHGGELTIHFPQLMTNAVVLIVWGLPLKSIRMTGMMPDILIEASNKFFERREQEIEAEKQPIGKVA